MKFARGRLQLKAWYRGESGQSLLETAVAVPLLLGLSFNIINFAYFWFMVLALSAAPRQAVEYASQGGTAISTSSGIPAATAVCSLLADNVGNGVLHTTGVSCGDSRVQIRVCTQERGVDATTHIAGCTNYGSSFTTLPALTADPEAPLFVLQRVDVVYQVTPIIPGSAFGLVLPSNLSFTRHVTMRNLYS